MGQFVPGTTEGKLFVAKVDGARLGGITGEQHRTARLSAASIAAYALRDLFGLRCD